MKTYTIIAGVNGVGKSSLSGVLKTERNDLGFVVDIDKIAVDTRLPAVGAGKSAVKMLDGFLAENKSFSQETTLSGKKTVKTVKAAKEKGYFIRLFYVGLNSCAESVKRIENRVGKGGHDIPREDVERRFKSRFKSLAAILPFCDEAIFYDNENGFVKIGEYRGGALVSTGEYAPDWFRRLSESIPPT